MTSNRLVEWDLSLDHHEDTSALYQVDFDAITPSHFNDLEKAEFQRLWKLVALEKAFKEAVAAVDSGVDLAWLSAFYIFFQESTVQWRWAIYASKGHTPGVALKRRQGGRNGEVSKMGKMGTMTVNGSQNGHKNDDPVADPTVSRRATANGFKPGTSQTSSLFQSLLDEAAPQQATPTGQNSAVSSSEASAKFKMAPMGTGAVVRGARWTPGLGQSVAAPVAKEKGKRKAEVLDADHGDEEGRERHDAEARGAKKIKSHASSTFSVPEWDWDDDDGGGGASSTTPLGRSATEPGETKNNKRQADELVADETGRKKRDGKEVEVKKTKSDVSATANSARVIPGQGPTLSSQNEANTQIEVPATANAASVIPGQGLTFASQNEAKKQIDVPAPANAASVIPGQGLTFASQNEAKKQIDVPAPANAASVIPGQGLTFASQNEAKKQIDVPATANAASVIPGQGFTFESQNNAPGLSSGSAAVMTSAPSEIRSPQPIKPALVFAGFQMSVGSNQGLTSEANAGPAGTLFKTTAASITELPPPQPKSLGLFVPPPVSEPQPPKPKSPGLFVSPFASPVPDISSQISAGNSTTSVFDQARSFAPLQVSSDNLFGDLAPVAKAGDDDLSDYVDLSEVDEEQAGDEHDEQAIEDVDEEGDEGDGETDEMEHEVEEHAEAENGSANQKASIEKTADTQSPPTVVIDHAPTAAAPQPVSSGRSLFDRISRAPGDTRPLPTDPSASASVAPQSTGLFASSMSSSVMGQPSETSNRSATSFDNSSVGDHTWKPDTPIKFGSGGSEPTRSNIFGSAGPNRGSAATTAAKSNVFGSGTPGPGTPATTAVFGAGGRSNVFGGNAAVSTASPNIFGQPSITATGPKAANSTTSSIFGTASSTSNGRRSTIFGNPASSNTGSGTSSFGKPSIIPTGPNGANSTAGRNPFGNASNTSTGPSMNMFGNPASTSAGPSTSSFGKPSFPTTGPKAANSTANPNNFGNASSTSTGPSMNMFGNTASTSAGPSTSSFGKPSFPTTGSKGTNSTANPNNYGNASNTSTGPSTNMFGNPASTSGGPSPSSFGKPSFTTTGPKGANSTANPNNVGNASNISTGPSTNIFGNPASTSGGPSPSSFGKPSFTTTGPKGANSTANPNNFGNASSTSTRPSSNIFSAGSNTKSTVFGSAGSSAGPAGTDPATKSNIFGSTAATGSRPNVFGQSAVASATPGANVFGRSADASSGSTANVFGGGAPAPKSSSIFGAGVATSAANPFGSNGPPGQMGGSFFGAPSKLGETAAEPGSSLLKPSVASNFSSRVTSPAMASPSEAGRDSGGDEDASKAEKEAQLDLTSRGPGEEDEDILFQVRARALTMEPVQKAWVSRGVGPLRVLKHQDTGAVRILMKQDPRGSIVINTALIKDVAYQVQKNGKSVSLATAGEDGSLRSWMVMVKESRDAEQLAATLEQEKRKTA
ncbi:MAG: hypothetical protein M1826_003794 [Phylliscum demangeonii]|nr:MAG: hypothetical protein M1826_003794 [Phylliscum demangeonii]